MASLWVVFLEASKDFTISSRPSSICPEDKRHDPCHYFRL